MKTIECRPASHPFFQKMPSEYIPFIAENAKIQTFQKGERIFEKGYVASQFYLLLSGQVVLETPYIPGDGLLVVRTVGAGEPMGWSWFFPPYEWHFAARAAETSEIVVMDGVALRRLADEHPDFGYWLSRRIGAVLLERLEDTRMRLLEACEATLQPI